MGGAYVMPLARDLPKERLSTYSIRWRVGCGGGANGWGLCYVCTCIGLEWLRLAITPMAEVLVLGQLHE